MASPCRSGSSTTTSWRPRSRGTTSTTTSAASTRACRSSGRPAAAGRPRPCTHEGNYVDLVWHELEFREADSFTYVVRDAGGGYLGCCYLYPMGRRDVLTEELARYDVDVSWWVTPDAHARGQYAELYLALRHWLETEFPFWDAYYSNVDIPPA